MDAEKVILGVGAAVIGGLLGLFAAYWRTRYTVKAQDFSKRVEDLCEYIGKLEEICCTHYSDIEPRQLISKAYALGTKTKITLLITHLNEEYTKFYSAQISHELADFFEACTGGGFESAASTIDPERQRHILISGEILKISILKARGRLY